ncbi:MAG: septal ring lytic transglycosylase RlpA family protein [Myxococcota bacterium]
MVVIVGAGCASTRPAPVGRGRHGALSGERGLISFYHDGLAGNLMANGKPYDPDRAVCAHKSLPFGTKLEVKLDDGGEASCTVSDRGPFVRGRILDVSKSIAKELGLVQRGVARGSIEVVR